MRVGATPATPASINPFTICMARYSRSDICDIELQIQSVLSTVVSAKAWGIYTPIDNISNKKMMDGVIMRNLPFAIHMYVKRKLLLELHVDCHGEYGVLCNRHLREFLLLCSPPIL